MTIDIAGKLIPNLTTMIVQLLSTGVMLVMFRKFLWAPVQDYFKKRADYIDSTVQDAKKMQAEAKAFVVESEKQSKEAAKEYFSIIEQAKNDANIQRDEILKEAELKAQDKLKKASLDIEAEKENARKEIKQEIVDVALLAASKIVQHEVDSSKNRELVNDFIDEVVNNDGNYS